VVLLNFAPMLLAAPTSPGVLPGPKLKRRGAIPPLINEIQLTHSETVVAGYGSNAERGTAGHERDGRSNASALGWLTDAE